MPDVSSWLTFRLTCVHIYKKKIYMKMYPFLLELMDSELSSFIDLISIYFCHTRRGFREWPGL